MKFGVLVFPGSSGENDCYKAVKASTDASVETVWHTTTDLSAYDCIILPGGSSYGNALRGGAIASHADVMQAVAEAANQGKYILGISDGFQILLEAGLLPGAMLPNTSLKFQCRPIDVKVVNADTPFTSQFEQDEIVSIPIAHGEGNYYCDEATLAELKANRQIVFQYAGENPNGSLASIAGICNRAGNVLGMMPYPDRAVDALLGSEDGKRVFSSILNAWRDK